MIKNQQPATCIYLPSALSTYLPTGIISIYIPYQIYYDIYPLT
jgi:hypothetical protein